MTKIIKPDYQKFEGVRTINISVLRAFFALMCFMMGFTAWSHILKHKGDWPPMTCVWAIVPALFFPWKYFYIHFIIPTKI